MTATAYQRAECERLARRIWAERDKAFPRFVQQTWEQGTQLARDATLLEAARRLGLIAQGTEARRAETVKHGSVHDGPVAKPCAQTPSQEP